MTDKLTSSDFFRALDKHDRAQYRLNRAVGLDATVATKHGLSRAATVAKGNLVDVVLELMHSESKAGMQNGFELVQHQLLHLIVRAEEGFDNGREKR